MAKWNRIEESRMKKKAEWNRIFIELSYQMSPNISILNTASVFTLPQSSGVLRRLLVLLMAPLQYLCVGCLEQHLPASSTPCSCSPPSPAEGPLTSATGLNVACGSVCLPSLRSACPPPSRTGAIQTDKGAARGAHGGQGD